jgi:hypothetical protein
MPIDDRIEQKRQIIRQALHEDTVEVEAAMRAENLRVPIRISVPSRYSIVTVRRPLNMTGDEWSRMSAIVREIVGRKLGGNELRSGRPLASVSAISQAGTAGLARK